MPREFSRTRRVADQIQRELAQLIQREMKDPRIGMTTVSAVKISRDLSYADVYVTVIGSGGEDQQQTLVRETLGALNHAVGFLRSELGRRIRMRVIPMLRFHYDESLQRGRHLSDLIDTALKQDQETSHQ